MGERDTQETLYPKNHPYSSASAVGAPDEQDRLQAEVLELRGRTARAELRIEVLTRALKGLDEEVELLAELLNCDGFGGAADCEESRAAGCRCSCCLAVRDARAARARGRKVLEGGGP